MIKVWEQLTQKEQSFLLLFNNNVSNINLQPDILDSYLPMVQEHINKEDVFQEGFIKNVFHSLEKIGIGKFNKTNSILFRINPLFSIFLKQQAKNLNKEDRVFIQSTYVKLYEGSLTLITLTVHLKIQKKVKMALIG